MRSDRFMITCQQIDSMACENFNFQLLKVDGLVELTLIFADILIALHI